MSDATPTTPAATATKAAAKKAPAKKSAAKTSTAKKATGKKAAAKKSATANVTAPKPAGFDAKVVEAVREAASNGLELGMKAIHLAEQQRDALFTGVTTRLDATRVQVEELVAALEARLAEFDRRIEAFETRLDQQVARIEDRLPAQAAQFVGQAHHLAKGARTRVRHLGRAAS